MQIRAEARLTAFGVDLQRFRLFSPAVDGKEPPGIFCPRLFYLLYG